MSWFSERREAFMDGLKEKRYLLGAVISAVVGAADWIVVWLRGHGMAAGAFEIPSIYVGLFVAALLVVWWLLEYAVQLRRELSPKLEIDFGGIVITPTKEKKQTLKMEPDGTGAIIQETIDEYQTVLVRGMVRPLGKTVVTDCAAFLTAVRYKEPESTTYKDRALTDDLQLSWEGAGIDFVRIPSGVRRYFNILAVNERLNRLDPARSWPLTMRGLFTGLGKYQLDLVVTGGDASEKMSIEIEWTGDMSNINGLRIATYEPLR